MKQSVTGWVILRHDDMPWVGLHDPTTGGDDHFTGYFVYLRRPEAEDAVAKLARGYPDSTFRLEEVVILPQAHRDQDEAVHREAPATAAEPSTWKEPPPDDLGMMRR